MKKGKGLRLGVIGLGAMGQHHARIAPTLPGVKLAAVADINQALAEETGSRLGVPAFNDYHELLGQVEAVCLVTPTQTHYEIAGECLSAGKHLLIEKPFTGSSKTAESLLALAREKQLVLAVNLIERYNPAFQKLLKLLKGEKIHGTDFRRLSPFPERISDTDVIFDMMIHDLSLLPLIVPDEIEAIKAEGERVKTKLLDRVVAIISHKSGVITRIEASRIFGSKSRKITVTSDHYLTEADLLQKRIYLRDFSTHLPSTLPVKQADQLTEVVRNFVGAIKGKQPLLCPAEDAHKALLLAERIKEACS